MNNIFLLIAGIILSSACYAHSVSEAHQYFPSERESHIQIVYNSKSIDLRNIDSGEILLKCSDFTRDIKYNDYADFCDNNQFSKIVVDWNDSPNSFWTYGYVFFKDRSGRAIHAIIATNGVEANIKFNQAPAIANDDYPVEIFWGFHTEILLRYNFAGYGYLSYRSDGAYYDGNLRADNYARDELGIVSLYESYIWDNYNAYKINWTIKGDDLANKRHCFHGTLNFRSGKPVYEKAYAECEI